MIFTLIFFLSLSLRCWWKWFCTRQHHWGWQQFFRWMFKLSCAFNWNAPSTLGCASMPVCPWVTHHAHPEGSRANCSSQSCLSLTNVVDRWVQKSLRYKDFSYITHVYHLSQRTWKIKGTRTDSQIITVFITFIPCCFLYHTVQEKKNSCLLGLNYLKRCEQKH